MTWNGEERRVADNTSEKNWEKFFDMMLEVKESVTIVKTRQEEQIKRAEVVEKVAYEAKDIATQALIQSKDNEKDIELLRVDVNQKYQSQRENNKWVWSTVVTIALGLLGAAATIIVAFL